MRALLTPALVLFLALPFAQANAQCAPGGGGQALMDGEVALSLTATESEDLEQDLLVGSLSYVAIGQDPSEIQDEINKAMAKAVGEAKKAEEVKVQTGTYQVHESHNRQTRAKEWRGQQSLTVKSQNAEELLELVGKLQDMKLTMNGLSYTLAPETSAKAQDDLMEAALMQLQERANRAAKALNKSSAELRDVSVQDPNSVYPQPYPMPMRGMAMAGAEMSMAAPVAEAGETTVSLTVSARAVLKP